MSVYKDPAYIKGKRYGDRCKSMCPYGKSELKLKSLWLAGWHDYQIENGTGIK